jgi:6-phosphogluconolactonase (cycloisomerase 2 family)
MIWQRNTGFVTPLAPYVTVIQKPLSIFLTQCNYTEVVWNIVSNHHNLPTFVSMSPNRDHVHCVNYMTQTTSRSERRKKLGILFYFWWQVWKERNKRVFDGKESSFQHLAAWTQDEIQMFHRQFPSDL